MVFEIGRYYTHFATGKRVKILRSLCVVRNDCLCHIEIEFDNGRIERSSKNNLVRPTMASYEEGF